jgi:hypothetical protein
VRSTGLSLVAGTRHVRPACCDIDLNWPWGMGSNFGMQINSRTTSDLDRLGFIWVLAISSTYCLFLLDDFDIDTAGKYHDGQILTATVTVGSRSRP